MRKNTSFSSCFVFESEEFARSRACVPKRRSRRSVAWRRDSCGVRNSSNSSSRAFDWAGGRMDSSTRHVSLSLSILFLVPAEGSPFPRALLESTVLPLIFHLEDRYCYRYRCRCLCCGDRYTIHTYNTLGSSEDPGIGRRDGCHFYPVLLWRTGRLGRFMWNAGR